MIRLGQRLAILVAQFVDGAQAQVQREGEVIHIIAQRLDDWSSMLASVGARSNVADIYRVSRADVVKSPVTLDPRDPERRRPSKVKEVFDPDLRIWIGHSSGRTDRGKQSQDTGFPLTAEVAPHASDESPLVGKTKNSKSASMTRWGAWPDLRITRPHSDRLSETLGDWRGR